MFSRSPKPGILDELTPYRVSSAHSNAAFIVPHDGQFLFLKIYEPKRPWLKYQLRKSLNSFGVRQPVEYWAPAGRRDYEEAILRHWKRKGFAVPEVMENPFPELFPRPVLTMEAIEGITLKDLLRSDAIDKKEKEEKLASLFCEIARRHSQVFLENDTMLLHTDANTRNILFSGSRLYHVDFEMGRPWRPSVEGAAREVLKLLVCIAQDTTPAQRKRAFGLFRSCYKEEAVYAHIERDVAGRSFQWLHRLRNDRKKRRDPERITLYDILGYLY